MSLPAPVIAGAAEANGVTVHFGSGEADTSVVIHHDASPEGAVIPVARLTTSGGVRVHRNAAGPDNDAPATSRRLRTARER